jgi:uncharacterized protein (DUF1697 family)
MDTFIALYRGINVVGKNQVKMEALRAMHEKLGHRAVRSYIQSGNIVFSAKGSAAAVARAATAGFAREFEFDARVMVVGSDLWGGMIRGNPFAKAAAANPKLVHACICDGEPSAEGLKALVARVGVSEAVEVGTGVVYLHTPDGFADSKVASGLERAAGVPVTMRNWRTMETLWQMANG